jgi:hypothetical protein
MSLDLPLIVENFYIYLPTLQPSRKHQHRCQEKYCYGTKDYILNYIINIKLTINVYEDTG